MHALPRPAELRRPDELATTTKQRERPRRQRLLSRTPNPTKPTITRIQTRRRRLRPHPLTEPDTPGTTSPQPTTPPAAHSPPPRASRARHLLSLPTRQPTGSPSSLLDCTTFSSDPGRWQRGSFFARRSGRRPTTPGVLAASSVRHCPANQGPFRVGRKRGVSREPRCAAPKPSAFRPIRQPRAPRIGDRRLPH